MIPVIDLALSREGKTAANRTRIAAEIARYCTEVGFFVVHDHGVPKEAMEAVRTAAHDFFSRSEAEKEATAIQAEDAVHRGYARIHAEQIDPDGPVDFRETFLIGWERPDGSSLPARVPLLGPNRWPEDDEAFRSTLKAYYGHAMDTAQFLLECFAESLGQEPGFFAPMFHDPLTNLVLAHYPVLDESGDGPVLGCGEHTDYGLITLLMHDGVAGLQVRTRDQQWLDASSDRDDLVVNVGDMMEFITGGRYVSNPHRVQVMRDSARVSAPFFVQPDYDALVRPVLEPAEDADNRQRWKPRLGGAYIEERYNATFPSREGRLVNRLKKLGEQAVDQVEALVSGLEA
ncbi:MAG: isopenicillin N synthase family oxygenase [Deltaproteobacteria bacterium]|nr:MAG: isopenicillin N synthase family oxygenase [Deltaproteobacteria bacterium]